MVNVIVELSKYLIIILMTAYTYQCFTVFGYHSADKKKRILNSQSRTMFLMHFIAFLVMYLKTNETKMIVFYAAQVVLFLAILLLYTTIYPRVSRLVVNNMCMLLCIGLIMLSRLAFNKAVKQFVIAAGAVAISLVVPVIIRKVKALSEWRVFYAVAGVIMLGIVIVVGVTSGGAKLGVEIAGVGVQPSELVKIIFVFFVASSFKKSTEFKHVVVTTAVAALHVLILVITKDLGAALIIFIVYLVMLYVATRQPLYLLAGLGAGSAASVIAYKLFAHVRTRVTIWKDPIGSYSTSAQVAQSLFAIGTGSWFGMGLFQGAPNQIGVADEDFIFAAISEEMGLIFGLCLILVCLSCYVMFLNIAMQLRDRFYKLVALGLGTCYIFQVFLTIGGVTNFIPLTGVTLPFVSYGGSSVLSTSIMFAIIQGLYILREDEEEIIERKKEKQLRDAVHQPERRRRPRPQGTQEAEGRTKRPRPERPRPADRPGRPKARETRPAEKKGNKQRVR